MALHLAAELTGPEVAQAVRLGIEHVPQPDILIVTGPPGAGKTTVAALVAATFQRSVHLVAEFHWLAGGSVAPWLPDADAQNATVIEAVAAAASRFAAGGYQVVVDGVVGPWFVDRFLATVPSGTPVACACSGPVRRSHWPGRWAAGATGTSGTRGRWRR